MPKTTKLHMTLPCLPDVEMIAVNGLQHIAKQVGIDESKVHEASILTNEAVINALEHSGSEIDQIQVEFEISKDELIILVRDYGKGFDTGSIPEPEISKKVYSDSKRGWGLKLMESMSDAFDIKSGKDGTRITMNLKL